MHRALTRIKKYFVFLFLLIPAAAAVIPFWMLAAGFLSGQAELAAHLGPALSGGNGAGGAAGFASWPLLPDFPTLSPITELLLDTPEFFIMFWNSCSQAFPILAGQLLVGAPAAWAFARFEFPLKKLLFFLYIALMLLPFQVTMASSYLVLDRLALIDTVWAIILPGAFSTFPVFIMTRFFEEIPMSLMEAAALDGAGDFRTFFLVGLPLGLPGILAAMTLGFLEAWNALEAPLVFLRNPTLWPLSLYLPNITVENAGISLAASAVTLAPALLIFLFGQKYLEQGICLSGLKE